MSRRVGSARRSPEAIDASAPTPPRDSLSPSSSAPRPSFSSAPRPSFAARPLEEAPRFAPATRKHRRDEEAPERTGETARGTRDSLQLRSSTALVSHRVSAARPSEGKGKGESEGEGFFHDLRALQPLRLRIGVSPLPDSEAVAPALTALLLSPRKFLTLPKDKGGFEVIGWAAAASSVSIELPAEGIYNKASVSASVMLPP